MSTETILKFNQLKPSEKIILIWLNLQPVNYWIGRYSEISEELGLSKPTVFNAVKNMVRLGYMQKAQSQHCVNISHFKNCLVNKK